MSLKLWTHCQVATMQADAAQPYGLVEDAALVVEGALFGQLEGLSVSLRLVSKLPSEKS